MIRIRSRIRESVDRNGSFIIQKKLQGRIFNAALLLMILVAIGSALLAGEGMSNSGIIIFSTVILVTLYNAAENRVLHFSLEKQLFTLNRRFAGLALSTRELPLQAVREIALHGVEYDIKSPRGQKQGVYHLEIRLDREKAGEDLEHFPGSKITIEDSTDVDELFACGHALSRYLQIPFESSYSGKA